MKTMKKQGAAQGVILGLVAFVLSLTFAAELSRSQPERLPLATGKFPAEKTYPFFDRVEVLTGPGVPSHPAQDSPREPFPFGNGFLQSNIWGGEVRAS